MYIPLCAKPAMLKLFREKPHLLEEAIFQCLATSKAQVTHSKLIVFIADGDGIAKVCLFAIIKWGITKIKPYLFIGCDCHDWKGQQSISGNRKYISRNIGTSRYYSREDAGHVKRIQGAIHERNFSPHIFWMKNLEHFLQLTIMLLFGILISLFSAIDCQGAPCGKDKLEWYGCWTNIQAGTPWAQTDNAGTSWQKYYH